MSSTSARVSSHFLGNFSHIFWGFPSLAPPPLWAATNKTLARLTTQINSSLHNRAFETGLDPRLGRDHRQWSFLPRQPILHFSAIFLLVTCWTPSSTTTITFSSSFLIKFWPVATFSSSLPFFSNEHHWPLWCLIILQPVRIHPELSNLVCAHVYVQYNQH